MTSDKKKEKAFLLFKIPRNEPPKNFSSLLEKKINNLWPPSKNNKSAPQFGLSLDEISPSQVNRYVVVTEPDNLTWTVKVKVMTKKELKLASSKISIENHEQNTS
jgi:hypothetical protein